MATILAFREKQLLFHFKAISRCLWQHRRTPYLNVTTSGTNAAILFFNEREQCNQYVLFCFPFKIMSQIHKVYKY